METIKMCTDLSQSKILSKILPLESADMWFANGIIVARNSVNEPDDIKSVFPCWSLAALFGVLPNGLVINKDAKNGKYHVSSTHIGTYIKANNPVDACYKLILKLHKLKKL